MEALLRRVEEFIPPASQRLFVLYGVVKSSLSALQQHMCYPAVQSYVVASLRLLT